MTVFLIRFVLLRRPTCVQTLFQFLDFICRARLPVDAFRVEAMHLDVVDEFFHHQRYRAVVVGQARDVHAKLP